MVHGRNAAPPNILDLVPRLDRPTFSYVAPAAANKTWYPFSFLEPIARNEPYLTSAINRLERIVGNLIASSIPAERIVLLGFSQGACLAAEFAYRHAQPFGGIVLFSGGLIGPPGTTWRPSTQPFKRTPIFLGCSDIDAHIPLERVHETTEVLRRMGATVDERIYKGMGHTINADELEAARRLVGLK